MTALDELDERAGFSDGLWALRLKWEAYDGGWTPEEKAVCMKAMLDMPSEPWWYDFLAGIDWTPDTPAKLNKMIDMVFDEGLIECEYRDYLHKNSIILGRASQVCLGRNLAKWLRETRSAHKNLCDKVDKKMENRVGRIA